MTHQRIDLFGTDGARLDGAALGLHAATLTTVASLCALADQHRDVRRWRKNQDSQRVRRDSANATAGVALARDLEFTFSEVEREEYAPMSALELFYIDSSVPEGYEWQRITRVYRHGEVQEITGAEAQEVTARVKVSVAEERFPVRHYATSTQHSFFQGMSERVRATNVSQLREEMLASREVLMEHANYRTWHGNPVTGQYGVLNYPWIEKYVIAEAFTDATAWEDIKDALMRFVARPFINSKGLRRPDALAVSPRIYELLHRKTRAAGANEISVAKWFLENNTAGIKRIDFAHELQGVGPGGTDAMIAYRRDRRSIANNIINPFGRIPLQLIGLTYFNFMYLSHGGVIMRDVRSNVIGYVTAQ